MDGPVESRAQLLALVRGYRISQAIYVVTQLGIPDLLADGPREIDELARATGRRRDSIRGDRCERFLDTTNGCAVYREENITWSDAPIGSRRVGNDGFDQNARASHQLLACSDIG